MSQLDVSSANTDLPFRKPRTVARTGHGVRAETPTESTPGIVAVTCAGRVPLPARIDRNGHVGVRRRIDRRSVHDRYGTTSRIPFKKDSDKTVETSPRGIRRVGDVTSPAHASRIRRRRCPRTIHSSTVPRKGVPTVPRKELPVPGVGWTRRCAKRYVPPIWRPVPFASRPSSRSSSPPESSGSPGRRGQAVTGVSGDGFGPAMGSGPDTRRR